MRQYPSIPTVADAPPETFERGHLWLTELVAGAHLRFQLRPSGRLRFGDRTRIYDDPDDLPPRYGRAVRHAESALDRGALRGAVEDVSDVVFFGEATVHAGVDYDWARLPPFLGFDVWSASKESFRPPDAAEAIFERLGLDPVNAVGREVHARDFDSDDYEPPTSAWYDGPAAGVVVRNKRGGRALVRHPDVPDDDDADPPTPLDAPVDEVAAWLAPRDRFQRLARELRAADRPVEFGTLHRLVLDDVYREHHRELTHPQTTVEAGAFRGAVADLTGEFLAERDEN
jgi:hypothetical protein